MMLAIFGALHKKTCEIKLPQKLKTFFQIV